MSDYAGREQAALQDFAMAVWRDPKATPEDRAAAKERLMDPSEPVTNAERAMLGALKLSPHERRNRLIELEAETDPERARITAGYSHYEAWLYWRDAYALMAASPAYVGQENRYRVCAACGATCAACRPVERVALPPVVPIAEMSTDVLRAALDAPDPAPVAEPPARTSVATPDQVNAARWASFVERRR